MSNSNHKSQPEVPFVDLAAQFRSLEPEINAAIAGVLQRTDFILGEHVELFEQEFAQFCGAAHAIGVDSGMSALELALRAFDIGPGDEVITAANTFIATALAISHTGATPVLVDIDPLTYNIDPAKIEQAITPRTAAILPVHLYGQPAEMNTIREIAERHGLLVIEDSCQAHGATYKGKRTGALGHAAAFSFYPGKNLGAYGDGGMIVTNDAAAAACLRRLRNYGQSKKYYHELRGYNHRLDTIQAAVLRVKLPHLDRWNQLRRNHAAEYRRALAGTSLVVPATSPSVEPVCHLYVIRVNEREELMAHMADLGVATGIHYPVPIHLQQAYVDLGYKRGDFPVTEAYSEQILSLPMYAELTPEQINLVTGSVRAFEDSNSRVRVAS